MTEYCDYQYTLNDFKRVSLNNNFEVSDETIEWE